jgi:uncharacterized protein (DUF697 family)
MQVYELQALRELQSWQKKMSKKPNLLNRLSKKIQVKLNSYIPDKIHQAITATIKQMVRGVLFGSTYTTKEPASHSSLEVIEAVVKEKISFYKKTAATEGGITGAGGILLGLADFPILLGIKLKLLFDIAAAYGFSVKDYKERLFILHIFQLAFSSQQHRKDVFEQITNWKEKSQSIPEDIHAFDWLGFQQEYRDYIDLAKLAQLIPGIGAVVGVVVNYRLISQLGETAMNAYRMRLNEMNIIG